MNRLSLYLCSWMLTLGICSTPGFGRTDEDPDGGIIILFDGYYYIEEGDETRLIFTTPDTIDRLTAAMCSTKGAARFSLYNSNEILDLNFVEDGLLAGRVVSTGTPVNVLTEEYHATFNQ